MPAESQPDPERARFTIVVEQVADEAWYLAVQGRPEIWTVAFAITEIEARARTRIALDTGLAPDSFDLEIVDR